MESRTVKKVLIVEPDLAAGMACFRAFAVAGFHAEHVASGIKALAILDRVRPDVIVVNLLLRDNQAFAFLENLRSHPRTKTLPVVAFARDNATHLVGKAHAAGANDYVVLGARGADELVSAIKRLMPAPEKDPEPVAQAPASPPPTPPARKAPPPPEPPPKPAPPAREAAPPMASPAKSTPSRESPQRQANLLRELMTLSRGLFGIQEPTAMQPLLSQMHENAQAIAADVAPLPPGFAGSFSEAFSALLKELSDNPRRVSPSNVRTIFQAVNSLEVFLNHASISSTESESRYRVLAVDDEPGIRKLVQLALESVQLVVDSAQDAQEALTVSKQNRYDLFVLDVNMPGLSGFELCQKLRASPPYRKTPVIFVTGSDNFESRIQSASSGANDFIGKPFLSKELAVKALIHLLPHRMGLESR